MKSRVFIPKNTTKLLLMPLQGFLFTAKTIYYVIWQSNKLTQLKIGNFDIPLTKKRKLTSLLNITKN